MDKAESLIRIYRTCFYISMAIMILGLANAVFLFFKFDVRTIFEIRTGRAAKRTIQKMAEANAMTGRLRPLEMEFTTGSLTAGNTGGTGATTPLKPASGDHRAKATTSSGALQEKPIQAEAGTPRFRFTVTQSLVLVHTKEEI